jgi:hypothetical protein
MAVTMKDEKAETVAHVLFEKWITVFMPPQYLLSDIGRNFTGEVIENLCKKIGTKKLDTFSYHPQTTGFIKRYDQTQCKEFIQNLIVDEDWDTTLAMAQ